ncbi:MAG TPA: 2-oxoacid:acceptor oxidoreductase family protein [Saprospiraceae bacterium]|nr:2-oxoacid:acceptor oxidoreductase family protein [Saprospiraceae bacterium]
MLEVRGHARGGQGMVTAFEILAKVFSSLDQYNVQAFPAFGVERTGAPIQAFLRVAREVILNRSNVYHPHLIVVFDESLLSQVPVTEGIKPGGVLLINTENPPDLALPKDVKLFTVPATRISIDNGLGSKALPIVNAAMIGAVMRLAGGNLEQTLAAIRDNVPGKPDANAQAAATAFEAVSGPAMPDPFVLDRLRLEKAEDTEWHIPQQETPYPDLDSPAWGEPMSKNKTGNWRLNTPVYLDKRPPCNSNCPAGTDVREFVKLAGQGKYEQALQVIYRHNPFPSVCGRVCPHFCEQNCNRNELDSGVNIGAIERFLGRSYSTTLPRRAPIRYAERVAVIGSGPAGLTAALRLREKGYPVTVFEAMPQAGGMMRAGIPKFRLPDEALDHEIERIQKAGVEIVLNQRVAVETLRGRFEAVIVAAGAHIGSAMHIEGEHLALEGLTFLRDVKLRNEHHGIGPGQEVAVIGGGNTAIDVARTLLRLGAQPIIYYRRTAQEMPAIAQEVEEAIAEGVGFEFLTAPTSLEAAGDKILVNLARMQLGDPDQSGRRRPVPVPGLEDVTAVDKVIAAIGQYTDRYAFGESQAKTVQGRMSGFDDMAVFGAGDMAWGGTVAEAIGSGNDVALEVHAFLQKTQYLPEPRGKAGVLPGMMHYQYYLPSVRHEGVVRHKRDFTGDFGEVNLGIEAADIGTEAGRCLHCGDCFECGNCLNYCPDAAISVDEEGRLRIDYDYCKGCGICVQECPCSAVDFRVVTS